MNNIGYSTVALIARVLVSLALLGLAVLLVLVAPQDGDHPLAVTIVGLVAGYWLGHAEVNAIGRLSE